jgi:UDP-N-acetyl-D-galactosamine dehydrogenase
LGYVGRPLAEAFLDSGYEVGALDLENKSNVIVHEKFIFSKEAERFKDFDVYILAVPTPVDEHNNPNFDFLVSACESIAPFVNVGNLLVNESTVSPGVTEEICIPIIENGCGLIAQADFYVAYSPERLSPGDKHSDLRKIAKIVSCPDEHGLDMARSLYSSILSSQIHCSSSIKTAELAKLLENCQRDLNIALMNEMQKLAHKENISISEVIDLASSKWNFNRYQPGLVGGHCIGVDPYYFIKRMDDKGINSEVVRACRSVNDAQVEYWYQRICRLLKNQSNSILVLGATFKPNCDDIRNSKAIELINLLSSSVRNIDVVEPHANIKNLVQNNCAQVTNYDFDDYDLIIVAVRHELFNGLDRLLYEHECIDLTK